jgi:hypothetical protein
MREYFDAPDRDRYQIITEHKRGQIIAEDTGLGFERTDESSSCRSFSRAAHGENTYRGERRQADHRIRHPVPGSIRDCDRGPDALAE